MYSRLTLSIIVCYWSLSLNLCFAQQPTLMLPIGHLGPVSSASFSPDGKKIVTGSFDNTAKIWDAHSGAVLADLKGHSGLIISASYSPDGKKIVTASDDNTAKIWDAQSGAVLADLIGHTSIVIIASFSPDGKKIVTRSEDHTAKIWDVQSGAVLADLKEHSSSISSVSYSPDGKKIVTGHLDNTATLWDAESGAVLANLKGHTSFVESASFSPNGKKIVTTSLDSTAKIWDVQSGTVLADLKGHTGSISSAFFSPDGKKIITASNDKTAKIWDAQSGTVLADLKHTGSVLSAFFSPDGKKIVTGSFDNTAKIWDAQSGAVLADLKGYAGRVGDWVSSVSFSPDGKKILTASKDHTVKIWDAQSGTLLADLKGHSKSMSSVSFSPDGKKIVTASNNTVKIWDATSGAIYANVKGPTSRVKSASLSPDGKKIVTTSNDFTAKIWDVQSGAVLADLKGHSSLVVSASFSPDGKKIVTTSWDSTVKIWDVQSGAVLAELKGHRGWVTNASFSPDGKKIVTASEENTAKIWDAQRGTVLADLKGHSSSISNVSFSPDGKKIVTTSYDSTAKIWDVQSAAVVANLKGHTGWVSSASFSPDGKKIVTASDDNSAIIWDAQSGTVLADLKHTGSVKSANFSPDGKKIVTARGNTAIIWDAYQGSFVYSFFAVDTDDYLIVDKYNHYDGTEAARKLLYFTCGTEIIELNQVKDQLWVPNLAERINKGETINAKKLDELNICGLIPELEEATSKADEYYFKIKPRRGGLGETVILVNGIEVRRYKVAELKKNGEVYDLIIKKAELKDLFIAGKENAVTVKSYTTDNAISSRGLIINEDKTKEATIPPNLYAVMVGVSDYKDTELDLKYAAKDATDISAAVANAAKKLLNTDGKEHVFMYNLTTANDRYQLPEKNSIKKVLEVIGKKATANDILLVFFAGHGVMSDRPGTNGEGEKNQFYFLTSDASKTSAVDAIADVGISTTELTEWMKPQNIRAQKRILIFDACNSGQAIKDFVKMGTGDQHYIAGRNEDKAQQIKAIDKLNEKSGLFILSASASNQSAYEMGRYSQGLLTYALLKAIKQQPEILDNGKYLDVSRWFNAAEKTVSEISKESGARQEPQIVSNTNFNIGIVDKDVIAKITLPGEKPLFASSNFQNGDENIQADDMGLNKLIDLQLNEIAARGIEATIAYASGSNSTDAYTLSGRYNIIKSTISIKVLIRQNNEVKHKFDLTGTKDKLKEFAALIASKTAEWASKNK